MSQPGNTPSLEPLTCDDRVLWNIWTSVYHFPTLVVADQLGLFPFLAQAPAPAEVVAQALALGPRGTEAMLGILTGLDLLVQRQGCFHLTPAARTFLLPDSPYYYGPLLQIYRDFPVTGAALGAAIRQDKPAGEIPQSWETGELPAEQAAAITGLMHSHSFPAALGMARHGDFTGVQRLLDVGGGSGCFCIALAQRYPELRCTVLDLAEVCKVAEQYIARYGVHDRVDTRAANMFTDPWPSGYEAVLFSNIFHDWDRASCLHLAQRSFEVLPAGGRIYLHELLLEDTKDGPLVAASFAMLMVFATRGKQFTAGELDDLLREAGFSGVTVVPTSGYFSLVSAYKPA